jgi:hypothetical protein
MSSGSTPGVRRNAFFDQFFESLATRFLFQYFSALAVAPSKSWLSSSWGQITDGRAVTGALIHNAV